MRTYLVVGLIIGALVFLISIFLGSSLEQWGEARQFEARMRNQTLIESLVFEPFNYVINTRPVGPIIAGLAWPAVFIWVFFIIASLLIIAGLDVTDDIELNAGYQVALAGIILLRARLRR